MSGTFASIVNIEKDKPYSDRAIAQTLKAVRIQSEIRVQPIKGNYGYLIVKNKSKAIAERDLDSLMEIYKSKGGVEYDEDVLTDDLPTPVMMGFTNDFARVPPNMKDLHAGDENWAKEHPEYFEGA